MSKKKVSITIKIEEPGKAPVELSYYADNYSYVSTFGIERYGGVIIGHNGQETRVLKTWTGCDRFEDFQAET